MSVMRCEKHDKFYDSDFIEDCPTCMDEEDGFTTPLTVAEAGRLGGKKGGKSKSEKKAKAARENIKKAIEAKKLKNNQK